MSQTIRVLEIISGFAVEGPLGGIERFGIELAKQLNGGDIQPIVCGLWLYDTPFEEAWIEHLQERGIEAFAPARWREETPYGSFVDVLKGIAPYDHINADIIHSHCQFGDAAAVLWKRRFNAKHLIRTVHNEKEWPRRPLRRLLFTKGVAPLLFKQEISIADQVKQNLDNRPIARLLRRNAPLIHNALNLSRFDSVQVNRAQKLEELGLPADAVVIGTVGRLHPQKGYDLLLKSAEIFLATDPKRHLIIVGMGYLENELRQQANDSAVGSRIHFIGTRDDVEELLAIYDLFVNSSHWEGLPTAIMESMAARTPVVATDVGGTWELIEDQKTGVIVPPNDAAAFAKGVEQVLGWNSAECDTLTAAAYNHVMENFSIISVAAKHIELYKELMG